MDKNEMKEILIKTLDALCAYETVNIEAHLIQEQTFKSVYKMLKTLL